MALGLLIAYSLAVFAAGLLGGWLPRRFHMTHTRTQLTMSLVAGLMLGVAFFHLIPHSVLAESGGVDFAMGWVVAGLVFMLLLLRLFHFHQHDFDPHAPEVEHAHICHEGGAGEHLGHAYAHADLAHEGPGAGTSDSGAHSHSPSQSHSHAHGHEGIDAPKGPYTWLGLLLGLSIHTVVDGIALGAVMRAEPAAGAGILGMGVFLAVLLHKPLDALSIETVMATTGADTQARHWVNLAFAALCPAAAIAFWLLADPGVASGLLLPAALAFSAGAFVCIALGDLLPEIQFHSHDRFKLTLLFLLGICIAWAIGAIEPAHGMAQGIHH